MDDKSIVDLFWQRNEQAISKTAEKYEPYLRSIAFRILGDPSDTEECVNDTYFSLWKTIPPTIPTILKSFVAKITRNKAINMYEKKTASKRSNGQMEVSIDELTECFASSDDAQSKVERQETIAAINEFLEGLDKNKRIYFVQRYWYMTPIKEIAAKNNISEGSLKTMLSRIRADLKKFITARGLY